MATSEVTTRPSPAQGRTPSICRSTLVSPRRPLAPVIELPQATIYPSWILQVTKLSSTELSFLVDVGLRDGLERAKCSASQCRLLDLLERRCFLKFAERVNLWRLSAAGEAMVRLANSDSESDIQLGPARMAKVIQFASAESHTGAGARP
jgi:hypothetical protein